tara:strand:+ start:610 stop:1365 length:756 start_codon:yes stop_codon:yes gene_type:complete
MILVTNGCSHTCGAELTYPMERACYEKAWPKHLATLLNCEHTNLADSGASAHRIVRTTIRYIIDMFQQKKKLDEHFFIILWPGMFRDELYLPQEHTIEEGASFYDNNWLPLVVGNDESYKKAFSHRFYTYYKSWVVCGEKVKRQMDYLHHIMLLQNFFVMYKIKYLFWNAAHSPLDFTDPELKGYLGLVFKKNFPFLQDVNECFTVLLRNNNQNISEHSMASGFGSHYDEEALKWFANYLHKYIKSNNLLP